MNKDFISKLITEIKRKRSHVCVGLDPDFNRLPPALKLKAQNEYGYNRRAIAQCILRFNQEIIDAVKDIAVCIKPQAAMYEEYGHWGVKALEETISYCHHRGLLTILDAKRGDIGSTAQAYARGYIGKINFWEDKKKKVFNADAMTINPYLGFDSIEPFLNQATAEGKGLFVLVKTSNPGSKDLQDLKLASGEMIYERVAQLVAQWSTDLTKNHNYQLLGAVIGATYPEAAKKLRKMMPHSYFLVPGFGAQGATAQDLVSFFNADGLGALINASRSVIFAYEQHETKQVGVAAKEAALEMRDQINDVLKNQDLLAWEKGE